MSGIDREQARLIAEGMAPEPIIKSLENGAVPVTDLVRVLREMEDLAIEHAESGEVPSMFKAGVLTACAGVRQQFSIEDARNTDTGR